MSKKLTQAQIIGISVGAVAAVGLALGLGLGLGLKKDEDEGGEELPPPPPPPEPEEEVTTWGCDARSETQYMCSKMKGGPFTAETCAAGDTTCKPCKCVMPVMTTASSTSGSDSTSCSCSYSDSAYAYSSVPKYATVEECTNDAAQKCGWLYGCDCADLSDYKCSLMPQGVWSTQGECRCSAIGCPPTEDTAGGGGDASTMGWKCDASATSPTGCSYVAGGPYATEADCRCFYAKGTEGPNCTCVRTESSMSTTDVRAFNTMEACQANNTYKCGWKYACDGNSARTCSLQRSGGVWNKSGDCVCGPPVLSWSCDPASTTATRCVQVAADTGQYAEESECKCWACDANSSDPTRCVPVAKNATTGTASTQDACQCVYAVGSVGPECTCKYDSSLTSTMTPDKIFNNMTTCTTDYKAKCGWKYACSKYGGILQCADLNNQYYLLDEASGTIQLLTEETAVTYDPNYKTNALYTDCGYAGYTVGEPAPPKPSA